MPKKFEPAAKERAVRMVTEQATEYGSVSKACEAVGAKLGIVKRRCGGGSGKRRPMPVPVSARPTSSMTTSGN